jgi:hypothetical protein
MAGRRSKSGGGEELGVGGSGSAGGAARGDVTHGATLVGRLRLGERQAHGPLAVFPLLASNGAAPVPYITLQKAIESGRLVVTEVSEGGSVPELRVLNKGDERVLVLDGQELHGAKQNRVLNTAILVGKHSTLVVPVSCTGQGRWRYESRDFASDGLVAERAVRHQMKRSSNVALARGLAACADQGAVWSEVAALHSRHGTSSGTGAMRDAYRAKKRDLDEVLAAFPVVDGQCGVLVLHGDEAVGLDYVSLPGRYAELHDMLLRSYAFEALVSGDAEPAGRAVAEALLERIADLEGTRYKSPGLGWDVRFEGGGLLGSVLAYRDEPVHAAFFDVGAAGTRGAGAGRPGAGSAGRERPQWRLADARERARRRQAAATTGAAPETGREDRDDERSKP